jgi:hypothetical protein
MRKEDKIKRDKQRDMRRIESAIKTMSYARVYSELPNPMPLQSKREAAAMAERFHNAYPTLWELT